MEQTWRRARAEAAATFRNSPCSGSLTYATVYRPPPDCTEARGIPCRPVLDGLSGPFVLVGHSYSSVPVTEVAAAREDVTHVVYVCAFAMPASTSMLDALGGQPREWWIFAEDGESIMPDYPGPLLYGECNPSCGERRDRETASALGALGSRA